MRFKNFQIAALTFSMLSTFSINASTYAADSLQLRPGTVFNQDTDNGFPITGKNLADTKIEKGKPALIFFGASGDLNTNRQAKRIVEIYNKLPPKSLKFILVDVDHPINQDSKTLIKNFYKGYIPFEVLIAQNGQECWSQTGEVQSTLMRKRIEVLLNLPKIHYQLPDQAPGQNTIEN